MHDDYDSVSSIVVVRIEAMLVTVDIAMWMLDLASISNVGVGGGGGGGDSGVNGND